MAADLFPAAESRGADLQVARILPQPGSELNELNTIEVEFAEPAAGVDASDLRVNGVPAETLIYVTPSQFVFTFDQPADGEAVISWDPNHGIVDAAGGGLAFAATNWTYWVDSQKPSLSVQISEFMAENRLTLKDEDGDYSDWIELFNSSEFPVNLAGWSLTDNRDMPAQWRFPEVSIPGKGFLMVYASGKNKTNALGKLHTNFKLSPQGEYLALVDRASNIASEFAPAYPPQSPDISYGRVVGAEDEAGYLYTPTPGKANSTGGSGFAPTVEFSTPGGVFSSRIELILYPSDSTATNVVLRYTLNGALPTNSSPVYTKPLVITNSVAVRVRAFQDGVLPGPPRSESYLLLASNVQGFQSDLPVLVLHTLGKGSPAETAYTFAQAALFEPINGRTSLTNRPSVMTRAGIQIRGSSTAGISKSSYKMECWDEFNLDKDVGFLGLPPDSDWVLYAPNQFEPVMIHNPFIHQLSRDMGRYSSRTRFVELYLVRGTTAAPITSTTYNGIYVLEEKIKIAPDRVAIDKLSPENVAAPEVTGGYLLKNDRLDPGDTGLKAGGVTMVYLDPKEREIKTTQRRPQQTYISNYFNAFSKALNGSNWRDPKTGYSAYIDVDAWIDFHVLEVLSGNVDTLVLSTYFHKPRNGRIVFGPHWDFDRALGSTDGRDANPRYWSTGPFFSAAWWNRLFNDVDFWQKWVDRWQDLRGTHFSLSNLNRLIDALSGELRQAQPREYSKWRITLRGGTYQTEINWMKNWLSNRIDFIDKQLAQPPVLGLSAGFVQPGTQVVLTAPGNATIFYTTNGLDPRASLGGVSPRAKQYTTPIEVRGNTRIVARAYNAARKQTGGPPVSTPWSGPVAATYVTETPALVPVEIMFHPSLSSVGLTNDASDYEYIEFKNTGSVALALPGFHLSGTVEFTFNTGSGVTNLAAGERVLVVRNRAAFASRYPHADRIAGEFSGGLGNGSGRVVLTGPLMEPVCDFYYRDCWAPLADGFGYALALADETTPPAMLGDGGRWKAGMLSGGSPGLPEPGALPVPAVWINEALTRPQGGAADWIELYNPKNQPADVSGWFLTDNHLTLRYRIPDGTIVPPLGYSVIDGAQFGGSGGFGLSAAGDEVFLLSATVGGELTGYAHGFVFDAADPGVSFGRFVSSNGREHFVSQQFQTRGGPNAGPQQARVVITEYCPQPDSDDSHLKFIELHNVSGAPVALGAAGADGVGWRLAGTVDFVFPAGFVLPADGLAVVTDFDPLRNEAALALFQKHYKPDPHSVLLGPWQGDLDNTHGHIKLLKPQDARPDNAAVASVLVDYLTYDIQPPGPVPARGRSIARRVCTLFGDDPASWFIAFPSPGNADSDGDGLPDNWELANGLDPYSAEGSQGNMGDPDGDKVTNAEEYLAGTKPWDGPVYLSIEKQPLAEGMVMLSVAPLPNRSASLLFCDEQRPGIWQEWTNFSPQMSIVTNRIPMPATNQTRFYRLRVD